MRCSSVFTPSMPPTTRKSCPGSTNSIRPKHSRSMISRLRRAMTRATSSRSSRRAARRLGRRRRAARRLGRHQRLDLLGRHAARQRRELARARLDVLASAPSSDSMKRARSSSSARRAGRRRLQDRLDLHRSQAGGDRRQPRRVGRLGLRLAVSRSRAGASPRRASARARWRSSGSTPAWGAARTGSRPAAARRCRTPRSRAPSTSGAASPPTLRSSSLINAASAAGATVSAYSMISATFCAVLSTRSIAGRNLARSRSSSSSSKPAQVGLAADDLAARRRRCTRR